VQIGTTQLAGNVINKRRNYSESTSSGQWMTHTSMSRDIRLDIGQWIFTWRDTGRCALWLTRVTLIIPLQSNTHMHIYTCCLSTHIMVRNTTITKHPPFLANTPNRQSYRTLRNRLHNQFKVSSVEITSVNNKQKYTKN